MAAFASTSSDHNTLRALLSRHYRLEQFDLFFVPSLHIARIILSQLFLRQEQARNHSRYAALYPISELNILPAVPVNAGSIALVPHVDIPQGRVCGLKECHSRGVTDATESFATLLHEQLVDEASLFVSRLDRHADLSADLVLIALRTQDFSTLVRSELRLFEQSMPLDEAVKAALARMKSADWRPWNVAVVDALQVAATGGLHACQQPGLPFACFTLTPEQRLRLPERLDRGMHFWPREKKLQVDAWARSNGKKRVNMTQNVRKRVTALFSGDIKSEKSA
ncbi:DUF6024 family protein [[Erwinia] mediterraneensis]|uniref:DUF6024 family protein n=1 Tax=[Erwinia] mediterraneensis TaxID=2161819 RepID=UPI00103074FD|nr:DUF6024 family protein [[Erwinia] mediterraneensis]